MKVFAGIVVGVVLSVVYVKLGVSPPAVLQPADAVRSMLVIGATEIAVDERDRDEIQRSIATRIREKPDLFVELDGALDHLVTEEFIFRKRVQGAVLRLQQRAQTMNRAIEDHPALAINLQTLLQELPAEAREDSHLIATFLEQRFPGASDTEVVDALVTLSLRELLDMPPAYVSTIVFVVREPGRVRLVVKPDAGPGVLLIDDQPLPAGAYKVYWDRRDGGGAYVDPGVGAAFTLSIDGVERTHGAVRSPDPAIPLPVDAAPPVSGSA
jgi:hypothetical protein